jgi:drug/metabolite transporter (DMT)-like permease
MKIEPWLKLSLLALGAGAAQVLLAKSLMDRALTPPVISFYGLSLAFLANAALNGARGTSMRVPRAAWPYFVALSLGSVVCNYGAVYALGHAPNPGYAEAVSALRVVLISLVSVPLFGAKLSRRNLLGVGLAVVGTALLGA